MTTKKHTDPDDLLGRIDAIWDAFHFDDAYWNRVADLQVEDWTGGGWIEEDGRRIVYARPMFELLAANDEETDDDDWIVTNTAERLCHELGEFDNEKCWACDDNIWHGNHLLRRGLCSPCRKALLPTDEPVQN